MTKTKIKLGDPVKSTVSGFRGTVTGKATYLHGQPQFLVTARATEEGEIKAYWFAESELKPSPIVNEWR